MLVIHIETLKCLNFLDFYNNINIAKLSGVHYVEKIEPNVVDRMASLYERENHCENQMRIKPVKRLLEGVLEKNVLVIGRREDIFRVSS